MLHKLSTFLGGLLIGLLAAGLLLLIIRPKPRYSIKLHPPPTAAPLQIHVAGAVVKPGVVQISPGSIVEQAISAAGGPTEEADLSRLNLAAELQGGEQIYVPSVEGNQSDPVVNQSDAVSIDQVNINTANEVQLEQLPGIGPSLASNIVAYREQHGWFHEKEELLEVTGIGPAKLEQIADLITLH
jgi:competence protein ComEA